MTKCVKKLGATHNMQSNPKTCDITQQLVAVGSNESALFFFVAFGSITEQASDDTAYIYLVLANI